MTPSKFQIADFSTHYATLWMNEGWRDYVRDQVPKLVKLDGTLFGSLPALVNQEVRALKQPSELTHTPTASVQRMR